MYFYFYDALAQDKKYEGVVSACESKLIDLGINGRNERLTLFKNARELIEDAIKMGATTVVGVGDDSTFATLVNIAAPYDVTVGFLPLMEGTRFGELLGMQPGEEGCVTLSRRLTETVDLGKVNDATFLGAAEITTNLERVRIECDGVYTIQSLSSDNRLRLMNLGDVLHDTPVRQHDVHDARLELVVTPAARGGLLKRNRDDDVARESVFPCSKISITCEESTASVVADGVTTINTPCDISVIRDGLTVIVGRQRLLQSANATQTPQ